MKYALITLSTVVLSIGIGLGLFWLSGAEFVRCEGMAAIVGLSIGIGMFAGLTVFWRIGQ